MALDTCRDEGFEEQMKLLVHTGDPAQNRLRRFHQARVDGVIDETQWLEEWASVMSWERVHRIEAERVQRACDNDDPSSAKQREMVSDGNDPRVCDNAIVVTPSDTEVESSREQIISHKPETVTTIGESACDNDRPRGDVSSRDCVLEQRIWTMATLAMESPFLRTRPQQIEAFGNVFGLKTKTYDRRLREMREGWRPPFRRAS